MQKIAISTVLLLTVAGSAHAQFTQGNVVVNRFGTGSAALAATGTVASLYEYLPSTANQGSAVSTLAIPSTGVNSFVYSGTATSEGFLTMSANGQYMTIAGYNALAGATVVAQQSATVPRSIGRIDWAAGTVDTSTRLNNLGQPGNPRSSVSNNGTDFWMSTSAAGEWYASPLGTSTGTQISSAAPSNLRVSNIFAGQLFASTGSGPQGIYSIGAGLPTAGLVAPVSVLDTSSTSIVSPSAPASPYDFLLFNLSGSGAIQNGTVAYVADDRSIANNGGIQRWNYNGSSWTLAYILGTGTIAAGTTSTVGARGLAGEVDGAGVVTLFATTAESTVNRLLRIDDNLANINNGGATFTTLATAATNTAFRGVEYIPVPTPSAAALIGLGGLIASRRRRA